MVFPVVIYGWESWTVRKSEHRRVDVAAQMQRQPGAQFFLPLGTVHIYMLSGVQIFATSCAVHLVKAMVFLVVRYGCESWTVKKAEHQRIEVFEL